MTFLEIIKVDNNNDSNITQLSTSEKKLSKDTSMLIYLAFIWLDYVTCDQILKFKAVVG